MTAAPAAQWAENPAPGWSYPYPRRGHRAKPGGRDMAYRDSSVPSAIRPRGRALASRRPASPQLGVGDTAAAGAEHGMQVERRRVTRRASIVSGPREQFRPTAAAPWSTRMAPIGRRSPDAPGRAPARQRHGGSRCRAHRGLPANRLLLPRRLHGLRRLCRCRAAAAAHSGRRVRARLRGPPGFAAADSPAAEPALAGRGHVGLRGERTVRAIEEHNRSRHKVLTPVAQWRRAVGKPVTRRR